jgi:hypothetical protein
MLLNTVAALALTVLGPAAAQTNPQTAQKTQITVAKDDPTLRAFKAKKAEIDSRANSDLKALATKQKKAEAAIANDSTLSPSDKAAKLTATQKDFAGQRKAVYDRVRTETTAARAERLKALAVKRKAKPQPVVDKSKVRTIRSGK